MRGNNIPINGPLLLEELANLLTHLIATLSRHQTDGLEDGKRDPDYLFMRSYTGKSTTRKVVYIWRTIVND